MSAPDAIRTKRFEGRVFATVNDQTMKRVRRVKRRFGNMSTTVRYILERGLDVIERERELEKRNHEQTSKA